jgi:hypothetical protein
MTAELSYLHECSPPPVDADNPGRTRWYCHDCGTLHQFLRVMRGRRRIGEWRVVERPTPKVQVSMRRSGETSEVEDLPDWWLTEGDTIEVDGCYVITIEAIA